jgi:hypothetical protein
MKSPSAEDGRRTLDRSTQEVAVLGEVATDGMLGLLRVLRRTGAADAPAGQVPASAALHALPGMGLLTGHEVLRRAHVTEGQILASLTPAQRVAICRLITRLQHIRTLPD